MTSLGIELDLSKLSTNDLRRLITASGDALLCGNLSKKLHLKVNDMVERDQKFANRLYGPLLERLGGKKLLTFTQGSALLPVGMEQGSCAAFALLHAMALQQNGMAGVEDLFLRTVGGPVDKYSYLQGMDLDIEGYTIMLNTLYTYVLMIIFTSCDPNLPLPLIPTTKGPSSII